MTEKLKEEGSMYIPRAESTYIPLLHGEKKLAAGTNVPKKLATHADGLNNQSLKFGSVLTNNI